MLTSTSGSKLRLKERKPRTLPESCGVPDVKDNAALDSDVKDNAALDSDVNILSNPLSST